MNIYFILFSYRFHHRQLKEENNNGKEKLRIMAVKNSEVMAQLAESRQSVLKLESELEDKDEILRENFSVMNENRELKVRIATQNEQLDLCHQEIESSRVELRSFEKIMSQLPVSMCEKENFTGVLYKRSSFYGCFISFCFLLHAYTFSHQFLFSLLPISFVLNFLLFHPFSVSQMPYIRIVQNFLKTALLK